MSREAPLSLEIRRLTQTRTSMSHALRTSRRAHETPQIEWFLVQIQLDLCPRAAVQADSEPMATLRFGIRRQARTLESSSTDRTFQSDVLEMPSTQSRAHLYRPCATGQGGAADAPLPDHGLSESVLETSVQLTEWRALPWHQDPWTRPLFAETEPARPGEPHVAVR